MDLFQMFLNLVVPFFGLSTLFFVLGPLLTVQRLVSRVFRSVFEENIRGKVVLITGASSGIGEVGIKIESVFTNSFLTTNYNMLLHCYN